jgi:hypothetical protein
VDIHFNFIGQFIPPSGEKEPTPEEIAENEKREQRLAKCRENQRKRRERKKMKGQSETGVEKISAVA